MDCVCGSVLVLRTGRTVRCFRSLAIRRRLSRMYDMQVEECMCLDEMRALLDYIQR